MASADQQSNITPPRGTLFCCYCGIYVPSPHRCIDYVHLSGVPYSSLPARSPSSNPVDFAGRRSREGVRDGE